MRSECQGTTDSERYLAKLCSKSFLMLWSYPNVFTDRGGSAKELCDLLVTFGDTVILFSVKSCCFKHTGDISVDWSRWYNRTVRRSVDPLHGAERWIRRCPQRLYLDANCANPLPVLPKIDKTSRIFRIAVAPGARDACKQFYGGGSGSLRISTAVDPTGCSPICAFTVGYAGNRSKYVHVFDDISLDIVMCELDTITDFCDYLQKKEELITAETVIAAGEEERLAYYVRNVNKEGRHDFVLDSDIDGVLFDEGIFENTRWEEEYLAKKKEDQVSYAWDSLIEYCNSNYVRDQMGVGIEIYEHVVRLMASLRRVERRAKARKLKELWQQTPPGKMRFSLGVWRDRPQIGFALLAFARPAGRSNEEYIEARNAIFQSYCGVARPHWAIATFRSGPTTIVRRRFGINASWAC
jgi:hypothetical protein